MKKIKAKIKNRLEENYNIYLCKILKHENENNNLPYEIYTVTEVCLCEFSKEDSDCLSILTGSFAGCDIPIFGYEREDEEFSTIPIDVTLAKYIIHSNDIDEVKQILSDLSVNKQYAKNGKELIILPGVKEDDLEYIYEATVLDKKGMNRVLS